MKNLISSAITQVSSLLNQLQVKRFLAVVLVGFIFLTTNAQPSNATSKAISDRINTVAHQNDSDRPKTTGEWNREAREINSADGEGRLQRIAKESTEAVKDFGGLYPDTADRSASDLDKNELRRQGYSDRVQR